MKKLIIALMLVASLAVSAFAQGDAKAKAEEIIKQARAAIGSESKFKNLQALSAEGTVRQSFGERQMESQLELDMMMPDKIRISQVQQFGTTIRGFDGTNFWTDFIPGVGMGGGGNFVMRGAGGPGGGPGGGGANNPMFAYMQQQQHREMIQILLGWFLAPPASTGTQFAYVGEAPGPEGSKLDVVDAKTSDGISTRLYFDKESHRLIGLSYKAKNLRRGMGGRGPGGGQGGQGGQGRGERPAGQAGGQGQAGSQAQGQGQRREITPEERERRMKEFQEQFEKAPEVDYRWAFGDYKSVGGLNLPHRLTKIEGGTPNEEWEISKYKTNPKITADKFEKKEKAPAN
ncbi:MAG: outer membrane lipoprotein carrier protein LolA [Blastocatellales bacterium]